jgi:hypothetical protein
VLFNDAPLLCATSLEQGGGLDAGCDVFSGARFRVGRVLASQHVASVEIRKFRVCSFPPL